MRDQNYATVADYQSWPDDEPGWFLLEWDIALASDERARFAGQALAHPHRVLVAPYMLYPDAGPRVAHRCGGRPIPDGQPWAEMVGFGCIYFPQAVLKAFWSDPPMRLRRTDVFNDSVFSDWHRRQYGAVEVSWTVHPQHLHGD